jgi:uncharacterized protein (DUF488 family)
MELYTIGHSTRSFAEFADLLKRYGIKILVDVRAFPTSARNPHFSREELEHLLRREGIEYVWLGKELGGYRRRGLGDRSPNKGWETEGFRNYADYMMTAPFERGIKKLLELAASNRLAYMCAERFYWRCHRRLISDYLVTKGHKVIHIVDEARTIEHVLPDFAEVIDGALSYPLRP